MNLGFPDTLALIDCAARILSLYRPKHGGPSSLRRPAVTALRALWREGDPSVRQTIVARVNLWLGNEKGRWTATYNRHGVAR